MDDFPRNHDKATLRVEHFRLDPADREANRLASVCPTCKRGELGVRRDPTTLEIQEIDICTLCGQRVIYTDVADLRKRDWTNLENMRE